MASVLDAPTRSLDVTISAELADRVDALAMGMERPSREIVEEALADWLDVYDVRHQRTLEGLADVDAGNVVDHERVVEWMMSLGTDNPLPRPQPRR